MSVYLAYLSFIALCEEVLPSFCYTCIMTIKSRLLKLLTHTVDIFFLLSYRLNFISSATLSPFLQAKPFQVHRHS